MYWLCAKKVSGGFEDSLDARFNLSKFVSYENISTDAPVNAKTREIIAVCDGVICTSGSTAASIIDVLEGQLPENIYSIGESCSKEIRKKGYENILEAKVASYSGLIDLVLGW